MRNIFLKSSLLFLLFAFQAKVYSQDDSVKDTITKRIENYFLLDRENIHLQFNKKIYFTNEQIAFKGYVYNAKSTLPFALTTNVYATLYNEKNEKIDDKLFYSSSGSFLGSFDLDDSMPTGKYYVHVFTNWMKNFKEDESSSFEIRILNSGDTSYTKEESPNYSKINIDFHPEGGEIIENIKNIIGVKISDCEGNPIPVSEGELLNSQGKVLQKIYINKFGYGKFELLAENKTYKTRFVINGEITEGIIPGSVSEGISIDANSYTVKNKTIVKIKANIKTIEKYKTKPLYLVVNQYSKTAVFDIDFENNLQEQTLLFENNNLSTGVNTIRIIDSDLNMLAERLVFKYPEDNLVLNLEAIKKHNDSIDFKGNFNLMNTEISISVVPEESLAIEEKNDIYGSFLLNPFLKENALSAKYYFQDITSKKKYELDLLLLNQASKKYQWKDIMASPPKVTFEFDQGLMLKGTVNKTLTNRSKSQVLIISQSGAQFGNIDEKNEFYFNNLILTDSTKVNFTLTDEKGKTTQFKGYPQIFNSRSSFNKPFVAKQKICMQNIENIEFAMPMISPGTITLKEVAIEKTSVPKLTHASTLENSRLKGFKISEAESYRTILQFIQMNGFDLGNDPTRVEIFSRRTNSMRRGRSVPAIFLDDSQLMNMESLMGMSMREVDEIYLDSHATSAAYGGEYIGVIKIYMKRGAGKTTFKSNAMSFPISKGFAVVKPFKNKNYASTSDKGFLNFGLITWIPSIITNDATDFTFKIPDMNQKKVKILIEGFSGDGKLISEIRTIDLQ